VTGGLKETGGKALVNVGMQRLAVFMRANGSRISQLLLTLDSHPRVATDR